MRIQPQHHFAEFDGKIEFLQYYATLSITGAWREYRMRKSMQNLAGSRSALVSGVEPIPPPHRVHFALRSQDTIGRLEGRTGKFHSSFYPNCISEWNKLGPEMRNVPSSSVFKSKLLSIIHPYAKSVFGIHDPIGLSYRS